ncbi:MAG: L,D-transpeptidase [Ignavibacteria bacterium]
MISFYKKAGLLLFIFTGFASFIFTNSGFNCSKNKTGDQTPIIPAPPATGQSPVSPVSINDTILNYKPSWQIHYTALPVNKLKSLTPLYAKYGKKNVRLILALNRIDEKNFRRTDTLMVPDTVTNILSYSPYPYIIEAARQIPKLILISCKLQAIAAYKDGALVRWAPVSTGRKSKPTPAGLFSMNWKSKETTSTVDSSWVLPYYFNFNSTGGVALHKFELPGYPASHSCVRLLEEDAKWFFVWGEQWLITRNRSLIAHGTPVIVFDEYPWDGRHPWRKMLDNPQEASVSDNEIDVLMKKYLPEIKNRMNIRQAALAEIKLKYLQEQTAEVKEYPMTIIKR